jgi:hypothetical protein
MTIEECAMLKLKAEKIIEASEAEQGPSATVLALPEQKDSVRQSIQLIGNQHLVVDRSQAGDRILLLGPEGHLSLTIEVTKEGPILKFDAPGLIIDTAGQLAINADRISIHGREKLNLSCDGDASVKVVGDLETSARIQTIRAELGNVDVKANDDVRLEGERVLLNCDI